MKEKCQYLPWKVKPFLENSQGLLLCIGECDSAHCDKMIIYVQKYKVWEFGDFILGSILGL